MDWRSDPAKATTPWQLAQIAASCLMKMQDYDEYSKLGYKLKWCLESDYPDDVYLELCRLIRKDKKLAAHLLSGLGDKIFGHSEINQPLWDACEQSLNVKQLSLF